MKIKKAVFVDLWESFYDRHPIYAIAAVLKKHGVEVVFCFSKNPVRALAETLKSDADLVLYSSFSVHVPLFIEFDKQLKLHQPGAFSIIGGPGVSDKASHSMLHMSSINAVCIGEGDIPIDEFIQSSGECRANLILAENLMKPYAFNKYAVLDELPFPDRDPVYIRDSLRAVMPSKQFMGSRGCPYKCTYCHNHLEHELFKGCGTHVRLKSVDYFIEEIKQVKKKYPFKTAVFQDDVFFVNKKWGFEFCEKFPKEVGIPFTCNVRSNLMNEDVVRALKEGGCEVVAWAIESGDQEVRNLLSRHMSDENIVRAGELFNKYKIRHRINNVIGIPGESYEQMLKTLDLNIKSKPYFSSAHIFIPFDGLKLTEYAIENNYMSSDGMKKLPDTFTDESVLNFSPEDKKKIKKLMLVFPIFSRFPKLYFNKTLKKLILNHFPIWILSILYEPIQLFYWSQMYRVKPSFITRLRIIRRYFSYGA